MHLSTSSLQLLLVAFASRVVALPAQHVIQHDHYSLKDVLDDEFDAWMSKFQKEWGVVGLAISVVRRLNQSDVESEKGWSVETKGYGVRNEDGDPVTPDVSLDLVASQFWHMLQRQRG